jgi:hypothetical protein
MFYACNACRVYRQSGTGKQWATWSFEHRMHGAPEWVTVEYGMKMRLRKECLVRLPTRPEGYRNELTPLEQLARAEVCGG